MRSRSNVVWTAFLLLGWWLQKTLSQGVSGLSPRETLVAAVISTTKFFDFLPFIPAALQREIGKTLNVNASQVYVHDYDSLANEVKGFRFELDIPDKPVVDSVETPAAYAQWKDAWCSAVASLKDLQVDSGEMSTLFQLSALTCTATLDPATIDEDDYLQNQIKVIMPSCGYTVEDFILRTAQKFMIIRIQKPMATFLQSPAEYDTILSGISKGVSDILKVPQTDIYLKEFSADDTSSAVIFKFVIYPLGDLPEEYYTQLWTQAISIKDPRLAMYIPDMDLNYYSVDPSPSTTASPSPSAKDTQTGGGVQTTGLKAGPSAGVVVGSVAGILLGAAVCIGAAYVVKSRWNSNRTDALTDAPEPSVISEDLKEAEEDMYSSR